MKTVLSALLLMTGLTAFPTVSGAASLMDWGRHVAEAGNGKPGSTACMECHRLDGGGMPSIGAPRIAGQPEQYIAREIREVKAGKRYGPVMAGVVQNLSPRDIRAVALYYSHAKSPKLPDVGPPDPVLVAEGEHIATRGLWKKNIPACVQCHGPNGYGVPPMFPFIAGQNRTYLLRQLMAYAFLKRQDDPQGLMRGIARRLTMTQRKAVAEYFSSLKPPVRDVP
ncbi:Cytochrome c4 [Leptospirillum ferriphilum]|uniref:Cytochrome c4 n=2 Tax=Leptospirillum TaxID=179 RepID=A0A094W9J5_9BACT|nr:MULTISPECIES: c-type cytochrome [Leptospirillum]EAY57273.1 MAG: putative cytochrome C, class I [Leptospirillum rubarum]EDZ38751.1 MAG: Putative cytochrome C, class I [Leptospirillum sp. Group II '5-way CG']EIJ77362.1 MAG: Putative cytochrome C, class I [Leptospirillum sp. Group II 'C75']KGA93170.1 Cytochrome c4 [Leptospirillum ferriphilum]